MPFQFRAPDTPAADLVRPVRKTNMPDVGAEMGICPRLLWHRATIIALSINGFAG